MNLENQDGTRPFIGAGIGVTADIAKTNVGLYSFQKTGWHFTIAPKSVSIIPLGYGSITASLRYTYGVKTGNLTGFHISLLTWNALGGIVSSSSIVFNWIR